MLIALVGSDGSGKSTLAADLTRLLATVRPTSQYYLGLGSGDLGRRIGRLPFIGVRLERYLTGKATKTRTRGEKIPGLLTALVVYAFSLKRLIRYGQMQLALSTGRTVVTDRYPQAEIPSLCDGPGLSSARAGSRVVAALARSEAALYRLMASHRPDLLIRLDVAPEIAHRRKPDHDIEALRAKTDVMRRLTFRGAPVTVVDAGRPYDLVRHDVVQAVENLLALDITALDMAVQA